VGWVFTFTLAVYDLVRMRKLIPVTTVMRRTETAPMRATDATRERMKSWIGEKGVPPG